MVQQAGGIEFTVDANTAQLLASEKVVESSTKKMFTSFQRVERATKGLGVVTAGTVPQFSKMSAAVKEANKSFSIQKGAAQQVGFQLQDLIVQIQGGTSAFVALGQQGSQLAGAFGPGGAVLGAVIALASALGGVLYTAFQDSGEEALTLEERISRLGDGAAGLIKTLEGLNTLEINSLLREQGGIVDDLREKVTNAEAALSRFDQSLASDRLQGQAASANELRAELEELRAELVTQEGIYQRINDQTDRTIGAQSEQAVTVARLVDRINAEAIAIGMTRIERALDIASRNGATEAQLNQIRESGRLIESYEREQESLKALNQQREAARRASGQQTRRDTNVIQKLEQELQSEEERVEASHARRQEAILRQTEEGSQRREELLRNADVAREQSLLEISQKEIEENQRKLDTIAEQEAAAAERQREMKIEALQEQFNINEQTAQSLQNLADQSENIAQTINSNFADALLGVADNFSNTFATAIVQGDSLSQSLRGVAQTFLTDILASLIKVGAQYAINAALGTSATAAATAASVGAATATAAAWATPAALVSLASFGANAAPATAGIASTVGFSQGISAVPGLQNGGTAPGGQLRRVNEAGPELFTDGARQFLLPDRTGKVVSNADASGGGSAPLNINFNVENNSKNAQFQVDSVDQDQTEITINAIVADIESGNGPVIRSLTNTTNVTTQANG